MPYKVRAKRIGDGYNFEYGKGAKKLAVRIVKAGRNWRFIDAPKALLGQFPLLDNAKQAFETWAGQQYGGPIEENPLIDTPVSDKGTILEGKYGPPPVAKTPQLHENTDFMGDYDAVDPLDETNYVKDQTGHVNITAIGALRHVFNWFENRYTEDKPEAFESVRLYLSRKFPEDKTYWLPVKRAR
jgi:hypothetical protein